MGRIRNSAKALIIKDGKMAAIKIRDAGEEWYIMPGGGQEAEETLNEAVCREVSEELGIAIECKELLFVVEGVHGENFHRVDLIFSCEYIDNIPDAVLHGDTNQVGIGWLDISTLNLQPLYPSKLRRQIMNYYQGKPTKYILETKKPVIRNVWIRSMQHLLQIRCAPFNDFQTFQRKGDKVCISYQNRS